MLECTLIRGFEHQFGVSYDALQRRAQFMAHPGVEPEPLLLTRFQLTLQGDHLGHLVEHRHRSDEAVVTSMQR